MQNPVKMVKMVNASLEQLTAKMNDVIDSRSCITRSKYVAGVTLPAILTRVKGAINKIANILKRL